jgi:superfamily I DNA/RNA helicase
MRRHSGVEYAPAYDGGRVGSAEWGYLNWRYHLDKLHGTSENEIALAVLARTNYILDAWTGEMMAEGIPFRRTKGHSPLESQSRQLAIYRILRWLERDGWPTLSDWSALLEYVPVRGDRLMEPGTRDRLRAAVARGDGEQRAAPKDLAIFGVLPDFDDAVRGRDWDRLLRIGSLNRAYLDYYARVERRFGPEALERRPSVVLSTIHSFKGGEAHTVLLDTSVTRRVLAAEQRDPDAELRVAYVGITRARDELVYVHGSQRYRADWSE